MSLRLFVAIELPDNITRALASVQEVLKGRSGAQAVRWTDPRGTHLTLKFLGETSERLVPDIQTCIAETCQRFGPIRLRLAEIGAFPNFRRPRVLWVGLTAEPNSDLMGLQAQIERSLARLGFPQENRDFSPHLTLGRVRQGGCGPGGLAEMFSQTVAVPALEFVAEEVSLMQSILNPNGAIYNRLYAAKLNG